VETKVSKEGIVTKWVQASHPITWCGQDEEEVSVALSWELLGSRVLNAQVVASTESCQLWLVERVQRRGRVGLGVYAKYGCRVGSLT
jgi:hypothetical protein